MIHIDEERLQEILKVALPDEGCDKCPVYDECLNGNICQQNVIDYIMQAIREASEVVEVRDCGTCNHDSENYDNCEFCAYNAGRASYWQPINQKESEK